MNTEINIVRKFCSKLGWEYKDAGEFIVIGFGVNDLIQPIYVKQKHISINGNPIIEISYFGGDLSEDLMQCEKINFLLLKRNQTLVFGQWSIKKNVGDDAYEFRYNIEQQHLDIQKFNQIIGICIGEIQYFKSIN